MVARSSIVYNTAQSYRMIVDINSFLSETKIYERNEIQGNGARFSLIKASRALAPPRRWRSFPSHASLFTI
jgi:hypothetical protein